MESIALGKSPVDSNIRPEYPDDQALAIRCGSGDERAMREVFNEHEPRLRKLLYRNLGSREDAEELSATVFVRFWKSAGRFRGSSSLKAYLTRIALNLCCDAARKRRATEPWDVSPLAEEQLPGQQAQAAQTAAWTEENPMASRIREGMLVLEQEDRELLSLYYLDDWDYDEICASLGISYDVLRTRLVRARKKLRQIVEERP